MTISATLDPSAATPGGDGRGNDGGLRHGRGAGGDGLRDDGGLRDRVADDSDSVLTRPGLRGMSGSFGCECFVGLDRGDDRLDRDAAVGDQLAARAARG